MPDGGQPGDTPPPGPAGRRHQGIGVENGLNDRQALGCRAVLAPLGMELMTDGVVAPAEVDDSSGRSAH
ncbi:hypothetical protein [Kitasatospora sp. NPDC057223]|uniref:hypothetical protein n=1 Tax=Kitasatospora sp. NPDC057223 TaxID=3346055 RepID=UPI0036338517